MDERIVELFNFFTDEELCVAFLKRFGFNYQINEIKDDNNNVCERYYTCDPEPFDSEGELVGGTTIEFGFCETEKYKGQMM